MKELYYWILDFWDNFVNGISFLWAKITDSLFEYTLVFIVLFVICPLATFVTIESTFGETVKIQAEVTDIYTVTTSNEKTTTIYHKADLLEDGYLHKNVNFNYSGWKQLQIGHTYHMNCNVGYYSGKIINCWP